MKKLIAVLLLVGCERAALPIAPVPEAASCVVVSACPFTDPNFGRPWGGEMASCDVEITLPSGERAACYYGLGPATGVCRPDDATVHYYSPEPPLGYVVAASCEECKQLASCQ